MAPLDPADISLYRYGEHLPPEYWEELHLRDPASICRTALVDYEAEAGYRFFFIGEMVRCDLHRRRIYRDSNPDDRLSFQEYLVMMVYLLKARDLPLNGIWVNEKELPGGALFFRGPHALSRDPLERRYARDPQGLLKSGLALGGRVTGKGDASFLLKTLPRVPLEYIFYKEDDEFPAQLIITFDRTVEQHLPLDVIWALVNITTRKILQAGEARSTES